MRLVSVVIIYKDSFYAADTGGGSPTAGRIGEQERRNTAIAEADRGNVYAQRRRRERFAEQMLVLHDGAVAEEACRHFAVNTVVFHVGIQACQYGVHAGGGGGGGAAGASGFCEHGIKRGAELFVRRAKQQRHVVYFAYRVFVFLHAE